MDVNGFCPILGIFYTVFHPTEGSKVLCQVPSGSIVPPSESDDSSALSSPYFQFDWVKNYVIPKPQLCNRLVTCKVGSYRIVGYPVHIYGSEYERNSFVFNFVFVFAADADSVVFEMPIRRLARMFMALEEQNKFLSSRIGSSSSLVKVGSIIDQIYQDLNNYSECMIPIDESNTINMKLFPMFPPPPDLQAYHVPISTVQLDRLMDANWDPTMEKIVPFINGVNSINQIAKLAGANYNLTKQCIQHLIHYRCLIIVDLFQFSNIYAVTPNISQFISDPTMFRECQAYVYYPEKPRGRHNSTSTTAIGPSSASYSSSSSFSTLRAAMQRPPSQATLFYLYKSLNQGHTVRDWYLEHRKLMAGVDVRRFLSFGVIKGLIYRVHSYPVVESGPKRRQIKSSSSAGLDRNKSKSSSKDSESDLKQRIINRIIDVPQHFDSICTDVGVPRNQVEEMLKSDWMVVNS